MTVTTVKKWIVPELHLIISQIVTKPTGPWLDNGPNKEEWLLSQEDGEIVRKLDLSDEQIAYDDGGSVKVCFTTGEYLCIPHNDIEMGKGCVTLNWCGKMCKVTQ